MGQSDRAQAYSEGRKFPVMPTPSIITTLSLTEPALSWRKYPTAKAAKKALAALVTDKPNEGA